MQWRGSRSILNPSNKGDDNGSSPAILRKRKHGDDCVFTPISLISRRQKLDAESNPPTTISNSLVMTASWPGKTGMSCSRGCKSRQV